MKTYNSNGSHKKELDIFDMHASICGTLANPTRLKILALLGRQERKVGELAEIIGVSPSNISQHLAILSSHGLVLARKQAQTVFYRLADRRIIRACSLIRSVLLDKMKGHGEAAQETDPRYVVTID
jgi:ArsR family transcriptional regulator, virulence genes transcriptional regulator